MWIAFPVGVGVGVVAGGKSPGEAVVLTGLTAGISFAISRGGLTTTWAAIQAIGGMTIQGLVGAYIGGALVGTSLSYLLFGEKGAKDAFKLYTGQVKIFSLAPDSYLGTIGQVPGRVAASIEANRSVANNAAGLPTGTQAESNYPTQDWTIENRQRWQEEMSKRPY